MNLHGIVRNIVSAVNPQIPLIIRVSNGYTVDASGDQLPAYRTPGAFTGAIADVGSDHVLTVSVITEGYLAPRQTIAGAGVTTNTKIVAQLTGTPGGIGTYTVDLAQTAPITAEAMTSLQRVIGQLQPLTFKEIQHLDGLNIQGYQRGLYINGVLDGLVRVDQKGGDLVQTPDGRWWLVNEILEQWPDWVKAAVVLQDQDP